MDGSRMKPENDMFDMSTLGAAETLGPPKLSKACVIRADIGPALEFATTQGTTRAMFPIVGGEARGNGWRSVSLQLPNARRAASTALSTSAADPSEIMAKACSVAGLITSQSLTATGATHRPLI